MPSGWEAGFALASMSSSERTDPLFSESGLDWVTDFDSTGAVATCVVVSLGSYSREDEALLEIWLCALGF